MAENQLNRQLAAGIRAAQQGDRARARELLEGVLRQDRNNEQGWIWLAAVVESQRERRMSLERVLKINPNNKPAQDALNSMVGVLSSGESAEVDYAAISAAARTPVPTGRRGGADANPRAAAPQAEGGTNYVPLLVGAGIILGLLLLGSIFLPSLLQGTPTETPTAVAELTEDLGPTIDPNIPTATSTIRPSATFDGSFSGLSTNTPFGATFTPTATIPPTETPLPSPTLPALDAYNFLLLAIQGSASPSIYRLDGTGAGLASIVPNVADFDYNPSTGLIVFTRRNLVAQPTLVPSPTFTPIPVSPTPSGSSGTGASGTPSSGGGLIIDVSSADLPDLLQFRMFTANISAPDQFTEVTSSALASAFAPAISPDGNYVAFVSDVDGDTELYLYAVATGISTQVTNNSLFIDTDPAWSPDGTKIIFSSDRLSSANNDIFTIEPLADDPESTVTPVIQSRGSNLNPQYSPDGTQLAYLNINSDSSTLRLASADGNIVRDITFRPDWNYSAPVWTPDGNYILYSSSSPDALTMEMRIYSPETRNEQTMRTINLNVIQVVLR